MAKNNLLTRLIDQLDTLIPFLAIAHRDVFELIQKERDIWGTAQQQKSLPKSFQVYRVQITHSAFLLGFSYFEAFLSDLARAIYFSNPKMLPQAKQLSFEEILDAKTYSYVVERMIEKEVYAIFDTGIEKAIDHFRTKFKLIWASQDKNTIVLASCLRNCIIHNLARANKRLSSVSDYKMGDAIRLESSEVHSFGITARSLSRDLFAQAERKHLSRKSV